MESVSSSGLSTAEPFPVTVTTYPKILSQLAVTGFDQVTVHLLLTELCTDGQETLQGMSSRSGVNNDVMVIHMPHLGEK